VSVRDAFLRVNPLDRAAAQGKMKKLKGKHANLYQYDLPGGFRMWYSVDQATRTVQIEYIGPHP
jgi:mRNA-degrading endonuclease RelE of RelBE toxin-antitoxin system